MSNPPSAYALNRVVSLALQSLEILRAEHGQIIEDDEAVLSALSQEGVTFEAVIARIGRAARQAKADAEAADAMIDDLTIRRDRFRRHESSWRGVILAAMQAVGLTKLSMPQFSLSISEGKLKVIITDESKLPDAVMNITVERTPNKDAIRLAIEDRQALISAMIENGEVPPGPFEGAILSNGPPKLTMRPK